MGVVHDWHLGITVWLGIFLVDSLETGLNFKQSWAMIIDHAALQTDIGRHVGYKEVVLTATVNVLDSARFKLLSAAIIAFVLIHFNIFFSNSEICRKFSFLAWFRRK
jgi:hypothetical protein